GPRSDFSKPCQKAAEKISKRNSSRLHFRHNQSHSVSPQDAQWRIHLSEHSAIALIFRDFDR
ncbi:MAG: hypothetical protein UE243_03765, partial [Faecalibacterium prausnitzii]|nr:hypothetical protein [Faecalibacterium prausnitzii]